jgi:hypothetical protein
MAGGHTDFVWNDLSMDVTWHRRKTESVIRAMVLGKTDHKEKKKKAQALQTRGNNKVMIPNPGRTRRDHVCV